MHFSDRTAWEPGVNAWAEAVAALRASGGPMFDLTVSNPTACGLGPSAASAVLEPLASTGSLQYRPEPLGLVSARAAVAAYYGDLEVQISLERICLTSSTSEAYSFLFRLLCNPGDEVLVARPSYPLFDLLARLDDVVLREYPLRCEPGAGGGWEIDFEALEAGVNGRTRAVIVVHPNNPTGNYLRWADRARLEALCAARGLALIVDEVFLDYALDGAESRIPLSNADRASFATGTACLCFVLSGVSKVCALPQMKVSWVLSTGPEALVAEAMRRLEIVADTFLSVSAPMQFALTAWLGGRDATQAAIRARLRENLRALRQRLAGSMGDVLPPDGGWTAVVRVPRFVDHQEFAMAAAERGVVVQPGDFYGLPPGRCVISLLTAPDVWREGLRRLPV